MARRSTVHTGMSATLGVASLLGGAVRGIGLRGRVRPGQSIGKTDGKHGKTNGTAVPLAEADDFEALNGRADTDFDSDTALDEDTVEARRLEEATATSQDDEADELDDSDDTAIAAAFDDDSLGDDDGLADDDEAAAELGVEVDDDESAPAVVLRGRSSADGGVDNLIARLEAEQRAAPADTARRRLEDYMERKRVARDLEDLEDFEV